VMSSRTGPHGDLVLLGHHRAFVRIASMESSLPSRLELGAETVAPIALGGRQAAAPIGVLTQNWSTGFPCG
jgi:hypothetical protein